MKRYLLNRPGITGLVLVGILVVLGIFGPLLVPYPEAAGRWRDISYWQDLPAAAPPLWAALFAKAGSLPTTVRLEGQNPFREDLEGGAQRSVWRFALPGTLWSGGLARDAILILPAEGSLPVAVARKAARTGLANATAGTAAGAVSGVPEEGAYEESSSGEGAPEDGVTFIREVVESSVADPARLAFTLPPSGELSVSLYALPGMGEPGRPSLLLPGKVSGILGTDVAKRDIFTGIVLGIRWALLLGVAVSFLTVMTGLVLGTAAACLGGRVDNVLSRIYEFFSLMPMLPFLIVLSAVYRPSLWLFAGVALLFFWTKAFKPVYAMALHIREEGYIEAGKSIGTTRFYRIIHYVLPALLPYGFAVMALSVPGIILSEASVSILGLGDPSVVTWGQMLHDALVQGAVINRLWWWILPPGLMIAMTGIAFALIGRGLERLWKPGGR